MSLRKWGNNFNKKEFVTLIKMVAKANMHYFNYTKLPYITEKKLPNQAVMCFYCRDKFTAVAYDYTKFKRLIGRQNRDEQFICAVQFMAHEMRHYYQHRQINAQKPVEDKKTIKSWIENKPQKARVNKKIADYEYWFSSRELDANLYAYVFTLDHLDSASINSICNKEHFNALKNLYKQNGGKKTKKYFPNKLKKIIAKQ